MPATVCAATIARRWRPLLRLPAGAAACIQSSRNAAARAMTQLLCTFPATRANPLEDGWNKCLLADVMFALSLSRGSDVQLSNAFRSFEATISATIKADSMDRATAESAKAKERALRAVLSEWGAARNGSTAYSRKRAAEAICNRLHVRPYTLAFSLLY